MTLKSSAEVLFILNVAAGKIPQITDLNGEATPPPSPPASRQNAPLCWRHVVREGSLWLATWVGNIPSAFPRDHRLNWGQLDLV